MSEQSRDEILEEVALHIEELSFLDFRGVAAKRKRDREDAALRVKTIGETRKHLAAEIRGLKGNNRGDAVEVLKTLSELGDDWHEPYLRDAWPLAWKGWVDIHASVKLNSNSIPPETEYRITLTDKGKAVLAALRVSDENPKGEDPEGLSAEGIPARSSEGGDAPALSSLSGGGE